MTKPDWQLHIDWSMTDMGAVEKEILDEWSHLDVVYPKTGVRGCGVSGGRPCAMRLAIDAAKNGFHQKALDIAASTQMHPGGGVASIRAAGMMAVSEYLRTK